MIGKRTIGHAYLLVKALVLVTVVGNKSFDPAPSLAYYDAIATDHRGGKVPEEDPVGGCLLSVVLLLVAFTVGYLGWHVIRWVT